MLLSIDTSTRYAGVALSDDERVVSCRLWYSRVNHTAELMPAVAQTLQHYGIAAHELEAVAVALGPGGFSSLRVGLSVAKGLVAAAGVPFLHGLPETVRAIRGLIAYGARLDHLEFTPPGETRPVHAYLCGR